MTSQSPRIYLYKITFEEVPYYYYGVHKEKKYNEKYFGTPISHKWCWELYTPKKQILQLFDFTDEGWLEAQEVEKRLIKPFYNSDKWCLNEHCGGKFSLELCRKNGKKSGTKCYELRIGIHAKTSEERSAIGKKAHEMGTGVHSLTKEERSKNGRKTYELGLGIAAMTRQQRSEIGKRSAKNTNSQVWECTVTGHRTNPGALTHYQIARGIDTNLRKRIP